MVLTWPQGFCRASVSGVLPIDQRGSSPTHTVPQTLQAPLLKHFLKDCFAFLGRGAVATGRGAYQAGGAGLTCEKDLGRTSSGPQTVISGGLVEIGSQSLQPQWFLNPSMARERRGSWIKEIYDLAANTPKSERVRILPSWLNPRSCQATRQCATLGQCFAL